MQHRYLVVPLTGLLLWPLAGMAGQSSSSLDITAEVAGDSCSIQVSDADLGSDPQPQVSRAAAVITTDCSGATPVILAFDAGRNREHYYRAMANERGQTVRYALDTEPDATGGEVGDRGFGDTFPFIDPLSVQPGLQRTTVYAVFLSNNSNATGRFSDQVTVTVHY
jgi:spore coat protein U-like protein